MLALPRTTLRLALALFTITMLAGCGSDTAQPADEIIILSQYQDDWRSPVPEAIAALEGTTTARGSDGTTRTRLTVDRRPVDLVEYGTHDKIVQRLEDTSQPPAAAIMVVMGTHGVMASQHEQLALAKAADVPVVAVLLSQVHMVDDEELLDLIEDPEIKDTLAGAGYTGVPVVRGSAVRAVEGEAEGQASIQAFVSTMRQQLGPVLAAR